MDSDHSLPPELKGMVCSQLSARDLKSLRLVKKCWGDAAASALWREVDLDLNEKDTRSLDALLAPGGDGALSHVKVLSVKYPSGTYPSSSLAANCTNRGFCRGEEGLGHSPHATAMRNASRFAHRFLKCP